MEYGKIGATEEEMKEALKRASASFVFEDDQLDKGLDTFVGASSLSNLSGGQK